ncbi:efflux RND transporter periplasmic adaptor subunit [uncultured Sphingomonas sp.]|uniref:efflux RND transporter periplasmic adaptor subunit n=1 Tax=uncultured Sphingomonas sp. TaxID=158754 RepID=UPI0025F789C0|nr:efflux RND transporter periplasmic adaptor subunit [uncultured Sphingomonas sp.]
MARPLAMLVLAASLLLAACQKEKKAPPPPPTVQVAAPLQRRIVDWDDYVGRFVSIDAVEIRPRVSGYLDRIAFRDGQQVRKGELLFVIDPRPYQAVLNQARAQTARAGATLANAEVELRRARALFEARAGSQQELTAREAAALQARADLAAAQASERSAALNVEFTRIRAPLSGRVSDRRVATGNLVTADQTVLTTLVNDNPIRFAFEASEALFLKRQRERGRMHALGDPVDIRLQDETDYRWHGKLEFVDNALDVNSGVIRGRAVLPNPNRLLTPGMFGHMRLPGSAPYTGLLLPDEVVATDQNRQTVLVIGRDGVVRLKAVETGPLVDGLRVIRSGLSPQDRVVIGGMGKAKPGAKVKTRPGRIRPREAAPAPAYQSPTPSSATIAS